MVNRRRAAVVGATVAGVAIAAWLIHRALAKPPVKVPPVEVEVPPEEVPPGAPAAAAVAEILTGAEAVAYLAEAEAAGIPVVRAVPTV